VWFVLQLSDILTACMNCRIVVYIVNAALRHNTVCYMSMLDVVSTFHAIKIYILLTQLLTCLL